MWTRVWCVACPGQVKNSSNNNNYQNTKILSKYLSSDQKSNDDQIRALEKPRRPKGEDTVLDLEETDV